LIIKDKPLAFFVYGQVSCIRRVEEGRAKGLEQGLQKGRAEGLTAMLEKQLRLKFNDLDGPLIQRLYNASPEELDCWAERVLFASTLEEVFQ
jgi:hypothetical protein